MMFYWRMALLCVFLYALQPSIFASAFTAGKSVCLRFAFRSACGIPIRGQSGNSFSSSPPQSYLGFVRRPFSERSRVILCMYDYKGLIQKYYSLQNEQNWKLQQGDSIPEDELLLPLEEIDDMDMLHVFNTLPSKPRGPFYCELKMTLNSFRAIAKVDPRLTFYVNILDYNLAQWREKKKLQLNDNGAATAEATIKPKSSNLASNDGDEKFGADALPSNDNEAAMAKSTTEHKTNTVVRTKLATVKKTDDKKKTVSKRKAKGTLLKGRAKRVTALTKASNFASNDGDEKAGANALQSNYNEAATAKATTKPKAATVVKRKLATAKKTNEQKKTVSKRKAKGISLKGSVKRVTKQTKASNLASTDGDGISGADAPTVEPAQ